MSSGIHLEFIPVSDDDDVQPNIFQENIPQIVTELIEDLAHWLPSQGPLKEFIHHNTLHAYQDRPFHAAVRVARRMTGGRGTLKLKEYQELFRQGEITERGLKWAIAAVTPGSLDSMSLMQTLLMAQEKQSVGNPLLENGIRAKGWASVGIRPEDSIHPALFKIFSQYYDQGIATWAFPDTGIGLFASVASLVEQSWVPIRPFHTSAARRLLQLSPEAAMHEVLREWVGDPRFYKRYLLETALGHPGWSGMIRQLELQPGRIVSARPSRLADALALELIAEYSLFSEILKQSVPNGPKLLPDPSLDVTIPAEVPSNHPINQATETERLLEIWQEAFERSYLDRLVRTLSLSGGGSKSQTPKTPLYQTVFCIDDRECSLRRHLEFIQPLGETFATAGFFGVDCLFQGANDAILYKHCPDPVRPRHIVREVVRSKKPGSDSSVSHFLKFFHFSQHSHSLIRGWILTQALGLVAAFKMATEIFLGPGESAATLGSLGRILPTSELILDGNDGYQLDEMADRVQALLKNMGFFRPSGQDPRGGLTVLFGHGSTSANNPYFAAYDCGACSGKPGSPNSRAFAKMANDSRVRSILESRGVRFPDATWFVGALHDTTRDEVRYFDTDLIPNPLREVFETLKDDMEKALMANAKERCLKFAQVSQDLSPKEALKEVRHRSTSLFEARPEMNHATNAACVVGRRDLTRGLFLDRRAFMNSYDPQVDPEGTILTGILSAVVPVCGGISLEYFFSRTDSEVYGAGTKLPHNISGLIGVLNGTTGDLLTGLPTQMTEIHPPLRLAIFVEQKEDIALLAAKRNAAVFEWIQNAWVRYLSIDPETGKIFEFRGDRMEKLT